MGIDLLADEPEGIDLLAEEKGAGKAPSYSDLSKEDQAKAMALARQQISAQHPNMPVWLRDMMLSVTPKDESPRLKAIAEQASASTNAIPMITGGLFEGGSMPIRGIASLIPTKFTQDLANSPPVTSLFNPPENEWEKRAQQGAELVGSAGGLGKLFSLLKAGNAAVKVPKVLQNASALTGTGILGTPGDAGDKALGTAGMLALGGAGKIGAKVVEKVPPFMRGLLSDSTYESLASAVQKPHDVLKKTADELYDYVRDAVGKRKVSIPVDKAYLARAEEILPKTRATRKLISDAEQGDYNAVHDLQSHLYNKGTKALASDDIAISNQGEEIIDLRNMINDDLKNYLVQNGHADIAHVLGQGKDVYKRMMDTYFNRNLPKGIGKLVHPDIRLVPKKPTTLFEQNSEPMKKFLEGHPEAVKHIKGIKEKEAAKNALNKILWGSAGAGASIAGGKTLFDFMQ